MSILVPDDAMLQHEIEKLAVKAGRMLLSADPAAKAASSVCISAAARSAAAGVTGSARHGDSSVAQNTAGGSGGHSTTGKSGAHSTTGKSGAHSATGESDGLTVSLKSGRRDLVTSMDLEIQKMLMKRLSIFADDCRFLCEEDLDEMGLLSESERKNIRVIRDPKDVSKGTCFIIDPIDGTSNFVHGQRHSCTSIAMTVNGQTRVGVIYDPYRNELFSACLGRGTWLNGHRLPVFDAPLEESIAVFGTAPYDDSTNERTFRMAHLLYELSSDVRRTGSAALDLCWTACGRFGLYAELGLSPWDFAAGKLIAEEAGCVVTDIHGDPLTFQGRLSILCGRPSAVKTFQKAWTD